MAKRVVSPNPMLSLETENIAKMGTLTADSLGSMWNGNVINRCSILTLFFLVFTKCAENLENGRRLENISWRLWYREAMMSDANDACQIACQESSVPDLSSSCDSINSTVESDAGHVVDSNSFNRIDNVSVNAPIVNEVSLQAPMKGGSHSSIVRPQAKRSSSRLLSTDAFSQFISSFSPPEKPSMKDLALFHGNKSPSSKETIPKVSNSNSSDTSTDDQAYLNVSVSENEHADRSIKTHSSAPPLNQQKSSTSVNDAVSKAIQLVKSTSDLGSLSTNTSSTAQKNKSRKPTKSFSDAVAAASRAKKLEKEKLSKVTVTPDDSTSIIRGFDPRLPVLSTKNVSHEEKSHSVQDDKSKQLLKPNPTQPYFYLRGSFDTGHSASSSICSAAVDSESVNSADFPHRTVYDPLPTHAIAESISQENVIEDDDDDDDAWVSVDEAESPHFTKRSPAPYLSKSFRNSALSLLLSQDEKLQHDVRSTSSAALNLPRDTDIKATPNLSQSGNINSDNSDLSNYPYNDYRVYRMSHCSSNSNKVLASEISESLRRDLLWERRQKAAMNSAVLRRQSSQSSGANDDKEVRNRKVVEKVFANDCSVW